jgi:hypothetical protein
MRIWGLGLSRTNIKRRGDSIMSKLGTISVRLEYLFDDMSNEHLRV